MHIYMRARNTVFVRVDIPGEAPNLPKSEKNAYFQTVATVKVGKMHGRMGGLNAHHRPLLSASSALSMSYSARISGLTVTPR